MTQARNRGRSNSNERGSAAQRRKRKQALLDRDGDGTTAKCWECGTMVDATTLFADRITAGQDGGKYNLENLRVHCAGCSGRQGQRLTMEIYRRRKEQS